MTTLVWDQVGERRYETGVDRGVLYPPEWRCRTLERADLGQRDGKS